MIFTDFNSRKRYLEGKSYIVHCCAGIAIDLLNAAARDLNFNYDLYLTADGHYGVNRNGRWDGATADVIHGAAHLVFGAYSVTSERLAVSERLAAQLTAIASLTASCCCCCCTLLPGD